VRVTIEVGDGQELCYLLDREIELKRASRDILAAMPADQAVSGGNCSYGESVRWCDEDIAVYTLIRQSLADALQSEAIDKSAVVGLSSG
jgi:hypothetical protein